MTNKEKIQKVIEVTCQYYDKDIEQVKGRSRKMGLNLCRQMAQSLCIIVLKLSLKEVAKEFCERDHATALNSRDRILDDLTTGARNVQIDFPILKNIVETEFRICTVSNWKEAMKQLLLVIPDYILPEAKTARELAKKL